MKPTGDIHFPTGPPSDSKNGCTFTDDFLTVQPGTVLHEVWALDMPVELGGTQTHIADLVTSSHMTTTHWGDANMYFRHQDMKTDIDIHPEWKPYTERFGIFGMMTEVQEAEMDHMAFHEGRESVAEAVDAAEGGCPYAALWAQ
jgi:hypothetical protein